MFKGWALLHLIEMLYLMGPLDPTPERSDQRSWSLSGGGEIGWARPEGREKFLAWHTICSGYAVFAWYYGIL